MVTANVICRTFRISYNGRVGTCFTIDVDDRKYIITAQHIVKNISDEAAGPGWMDIVYIYHDGTWQPINVILIGHTPKNIDISVLSTMYFFEKDTERVLAPDDFPLSAGIGGANTGGMAYGQDLYYLGFPNIVNVDESHEANMINRKFPFPIVKHAIFSGVGNDKSFLIDGYGNPGFSGGPVVFKPNGSQEFKVAGVVVSYTPEILPVYESELQAKNNSSSITPIGYFRSNSGLTTVSHIKQAIDLIKNFQENSPYEQATEMI